MLLSHPVPPNAPPSRALDCFADFIRRMHDMHPSQLHRLAFAAAEEAEGEQAARAERLQRLRSQYAPVRSWLGGPPRCCCGCCGCFSAPSVADTCRLALPSCSIARAWSPSCCLACSCCRRGSASRACRRRRCWRTCSSTRPRSRSRSESCWGGAAAAVSRLCSCCVAAGARPSPPLMPSASCRLLCRSTQRDVEEARAELARAEGDLGQSAVDPSGSDPASLAVVEAKKRLQSATARAALLEQGERARARGALTLPLALP